MFNSVQRSPVPASTFAAFCLLLMLATLALPGASAQCSQAMLPKAASTAQPAASLQSQQPAPAKDDASWSNVAVDVRFATGSAITVIENTELQVITDAPITSRTTTKGAKQPFTVTRDVLVNGVLVIPCGAKVFATVVAAKQTGRMVGASSLTLQFTELVLDGKSYPLYVPPFKVVGQSKTRPTVNKVATGAAIGALVPNASIEANHYSVPAADRAKGTAIVAGVGAGIGAAIAASSPPSIAVVPAEAQIEFTLATPVAVFPVDQRTAMRLAQGMHRGGPVLYLRGES